MWRVGETPVGFSFLLLPRPPAPDAPGSGWHSSRGSAGTHCQRTELPLWSGAVLSRRQERPALSPFYSVLRQRGPRCRCSSRRHTAGEPVKPPRFGPKTPGRVPGKSRYLENTEEGLGKWPVHLSLIAGDETHPGRARPPREASGRTGPAQPRAAVGARPGQIGTALRALKR